MWSTPVISQCLVSGAASPSFSRHAALLYIAAAPLAIEAAMDDHTITLKKSGFTTWERKIKVTGGKIQNSEELQASVETRTQPGQ